MGKYTDCIVRENADIRKIALILEKRKRKSHDIGVALRDYLNSNRNNNNKKKEND